MGADNMTRLRIAKLYRRPSTYALLFFLAAAGSVLSTPAHSEVLKVGVREMPPGLGNPFTGRGGSNRTVWHALFDELTRVGRNGETLPWLATSWTNIDPTTWLFSIQ